MKVLHLCNDFAGSKVHAELYHRLDAADISQTVYCPVRNHELVGRNRFDGNCTNIHYAEILTHAHRLLFHKKVRNIVQDIEQRIDLQQIDLAHATTLFSDGAVALQLKKKYGIPYIVAVRNTDLNVFMRFMPHLWRLHREIIRQAERVIFVAPNLQRRTLAHWTLCGLTEMLNEKGTLIPNGINDYWIENLQLTENKNRNPHRILYVGKFDRNKNVLRLAHTVLRLRTDFPDIHLDLIGGDGEEETALRRLVQQHPDILAYHGKIFDKEKLQRFYLSNSIFAMISHKETFGLVYLEALSQGMRVLFTRHEGIDGLFSAPIGESVNPLNNKEIEEALRRMMQTHEQYVTLQPHDFETFQWNRIARTYQQIYQQILSYD